MLSYSEIIDLFLLYRKKFKKLNETLNELLVPYKISVQHAVYILILYNNGEMTIKELNSYADNDGAITTRVIKKLKKENYVKKIGTAKRKYKIGLTEFGELVAKGMLGAFNKVKREELGALDTEDFVTLQKIANKLTE